MKQAFYCSPTTTSVYFFEYFIYYGMVMESGALTDAESEVSTFN
jgi:hypothetical protein